MAECKEINAWTYVRVERHSVANSCWAADNEAVEWRGWKSVREHVRAPRENVTFDRAREVEGRSSV